jgi:hypothetical protein
MSVNWALAIISHNFYSLVIRMKFFMAQTFKVSSAPAADFGSLRATISMSEWLDSLMIVNSPVVAK